MNVTLNSVSFSSQSKEIATIQQYVQDNLVGCKYLFSEVVNGELYIHFGERIAHDHPEMQDITRGTHVLSTRDSAWVIYSSISEAIIVHKVKTLDENGQPMVSKTLNPTILESGAYVEPESFVMNVVVSPLGKGSLIGLLVIISDGSSIRILPNPSDPDEIVADWELFTPTSVLSVGPGPRFASEPA